MAWALRSVVSDPLKRRRAGKVTSQKWAFLLCVWHKQALQLPHCRSSFPWICFLLLMQLIPSDNKICPYALVNVPRLQKLCERLMQTSTFLNIFLLRFLPKCLCNSFIQWEGSSLCIVYMIEIIPFEAFKKNGKTQNWHNLQQLN